MVTTQIKDINSTKKKISITVSKDTIDSFRKKAHQKVSEKAKIKGFRPGKVPSNILEQYYGAEIDFECLNFLVSETYVTALTEHKLVPMTEPTFDTKPIEKNKDYTYSFELEIRPQFELKNYKEIEVKQKKAEVTEKELGDELKRLQESLAQLAPVDEKTTLTKGLVATIDFTGKIDGKVFKGGSAKDYVFEYGNGQLLAEFEEKISGLKKDEKRNFEITFPADYFEKDLAGKKSTYEIVLKNLHQKNLPNLDDELAKDIGKETLDQVKQELKDSLIKRKEREFRRDYGESIKAVLLKEYQFDLPESLIDDEVKRTNQDKKEVAERFRFELILDEIARKENIRATQQDVEFRMITLSQIYRQPVDEIRKLYQKNNMISSLAAQIVLDKTMEFLIDNAKMV